MGLDGSFSTTSHGVSVALVNYAVGDALSIVLLYVDLVLLATLVELHH